jgi:MEDS: MEthanogen/methylotroph, DcmR Sensory domain
MDSITARQAARHTQTPLACNHLVQFYRDHTRFLDSLEAFIADGLLAGESTIVLATSLHLHSLEARLQARGFDLRAARHDNRYLPVGADDAIARLLVDGRPDPARFQKLLSDLLRRATGRSNRRVRAFGELVAVLWANGQREAVHELEQLWCAACDRHDLTLLCAYPAAGFGEHDHEAIAGIRDCHRGEVAA